ncbi:hypothetical protein WAI453_002587 [Rhynchosporium graminicola]
MSAPICQNSGRASDEGRFRDGDCGSWVCDNSTGDVYGYVLSEFTGTGSAFIISFYEIFQDMEKSLGKFVKLLTMDSLLDDLQMTTKQITNADPRS